jgi:hypothetical protein
MRLTVSRLSESKLRAMNCFAFWSTIPAREPLCNAIQKVSDKTGPKEVNGKIVGSVRGASHSSHDELADELLEQTAMKAVEEVFHRAAGEAVANPAVTAVDLLQKFNDWSERNMAGSMRPEALQRRENFRLWNAAEIIATQLTRRAGGGSPSEFAVKLVTACPEFERRKFDLARYVSMDFYLRHPGRKRHGQRIENRDEPHMAW